MMVYGGISTPGKYLNDVCAFNLEQNKWQILEIDNVDMGDKSEDGLAFSTICSIFKGSCKFTSLYKPYEVRKEVTMKEVHTYFL